MTEQVSFLAHDEPMNWRKNFIATGVGCPMRAVAPVDAAKTVVIGANGCVGIETIEALLQRSRPGQAEIYAGVRDTAKFDRHMFKVPTLRTDMSNRRELTRNLKGFERAFLVVPCDQNRTGLASIALDSCKAAGVKFILLLSISIADTPTIFGKQFKPIEDRLRTLGLRYAILRLPVFMNNLFAHAGTIQKESRICDPRDPRKRFASVTIQDVGKCAAEILLNPGAHHGRTYKLVSQPYSMIDLSQSMSKMLGRQVKVREISWERFKEALLGASVPEWQIDGLIEWLEGEYDTSIRPMDLTSLEQITGEKPSTLDYFIASNAVHFGWTFK